MFVWSLTRKVFVGKLKGHVVWLNRQLFGETNIDADFLEESSLA